MNHFLIQFYNRENIGIVLIINCIENIKFMLTPLAIWNCQHNVDLLKKSINIFRSGRVIQLEFSDIYNYAIFKHLPKQKLWLLPFRRLRFQFAPSKHWSEFLIFQLS
jgi:hypothetical protein